MNLQTIYGGHPTIMMFLISLIQLFSLFELLEIDHQDLARHEFMFCPQMKISKQIMSRMKVFIYVYLYIDVSKISLYRFRYLMCVKWESKFIELIIWNILTAVGRYQHDLSFEIQFLINDWDFTLLYYSNIRFGTRLIWQIT